jgi:hypothetical protein
MRNIHDIDTCINILRDEGCDVRQIKDKTNITNNNGIITYQKHSKFKPFNDVFVAFIFALFFSGLLSLVFAELGIIWSIVAFFFLSSLIDPLAFVLSDGWECFFKYKMLYLGLTFISLIIVIMLSYNIHIEHLEYEVSLSWNRNDTELVQKYEYLKNLPHWLFHIK